MNALVSVIVPVWNGERHFAATLDSVLGQTYPNLEVIVVDDGSTDGSAAMAAKHPGIHVIRQPNRGTGAARNAGLAAASGTLIAHMDADDLWVPEKVALQVTALEAAPEAHAVCGHVTEFVSEDLPEEARRRMRPPRENLPGHVLQAMLIRADFHRVVGRFEEEWKVAQDMAWYLRAVEAGLRLEVIPEVVTLRRLHATNKGITERSHARQRLEILKAALDRRRRAPPDR